MSSTDFGFTTTNSKDAVGDPAAAMALAKRDGHLAGGGGGECSSCWGTKSGGSGRKSTAGAKNPFAKLCNPCLDGLGRHVRKPQPGPLGEAYRDLLGDCALPVFTDSERKSVSPELLRILESVNDATTLQDFYFQVGNTPKSRTEHVPLDSKSGFLPLSEKKKKSIGKKFTEKSHSNKLIGIQLVRDSNFCTSRRTDLCEVHWFYLICRSIFR